MTKNNYNKDLTNSTDLEWTESSVEFKYFNESSSNVSDTKNKNLTKVNSCVENSNVEGYNVNMLNLSSAILSQSQIRKPVSKFDKINKFKSKSKKLQKKKPIYIGHINISNKVSEKISCSSDSCSLNNSLLDIFRDKNINGSSVSKQKTVIIPLIESFIPCSNVSPLVGDNKVYQSKSGSRKSVIFIPSIDNAKSLQEIKQDSILTPEETEIYTQLSCKTRKMKGLHKRALRKEFMNQTKNGKMHVESKIDGNSKSCFCSCDNFSTKGFAPVSKPLMHNLSRSIDSLQGSIEESLDIEQSRISKIAPPRYITRSQISLFNTMKEKTQIGELLVSKKNISENLFNLSNNELIQEVFQSIKENQMTELCEEMKAERESQQSIYLVEGKLFENPLDYDLNNRLKIDSNVSEYNNKNKKENLDQLRDIFSVVSTSSSEFGKNSYSNCESHNGILLNINNFDKSSKKIDLCHYSYNSQVSKAKFPKNDGISNIRDLNPVESANDPKSKDSQSQPKYFLRSQKNLSNNIMNSITTNKKLTTHLDLNLIAEKSKNDLVSSFLCDDFIQDLEQTSDKIFNINRSHSLIATNSHEESLKTDIDDEKDSKTKKIETNVLLFISILNDSNILGIVEPTDDVKNDSKLSSNSHSSKIDPSKSNTSQHRHNSSSRYSLQQEKFSKNKSVNQVKYNLRGHNREMLVQSVCKLSTENDNNKIFKNISKFDLNLLTKNRLVTSYSSEDHLTNSSTELQIARESTDDLIKQQFKESETQLLRVQKDLCNNNKLLINNEDGSQIVAAQNHDFSLVNNINNNIEKSVLPLPIHLISSWSDNCKINHQDSSEQLTRIERKEMQKNVNQLCANGVDYIEYSNKNIDINYDRCINESTSKHTLIDISNRQKTSTSFPEKFVSTVNQVKNLTKDFCDNNLMNKNQSEFLKNINEQERLKFCQFNIPKKADETESQTKHLNDEETKLNSKNDLENQYSLLGYKSSQSKQTLIDKNDLLVETFPTFLVNAENEKNYLESTRLPNAIIKTVNIECSPIISVVSTDDQKTDIETIISDSVQSNTEIDDNENGSDDKLECIQECSGEESENLDANFFIMKNKFDIIEEKDEEEGKQNTEDEMKTKEDIEINEKNSQSIIDGISSRNISNKFRKSKFIFPSPIKYDQELKKFHDNIGHFIKTKNEIEQSSTSNTTNTKSNRRNISFVNPTDPIITFKGIFPGRNGKRTRARPISGPFERIVYKDGIIHHREVFPSPDLIRKRKQVLRKLCKKGEQISKSSIKKNMEKFDISKYDESPDGVSVVLLNHFSKVKESTKVIFPSEHYHNIGLCKMNKYSIGKKLSTSSKTNHRSETVIEIFSHNKDISVVIVVDQCKLVLRNDQKIIIPKGVEYFICNPNNQIICVFEIISLPDKIDTEKL